MFSLTKSFPGDIDILLCSQPIVFGMHAVRKNYAWKYDNIVSYRNFSSFLLHHSTTCISIYVLTSICSNAKNMFPEHEKQQKGVESAMGRSTIDPPGQALGRV